MSAGIKIDNRFAKSKAEVKRALASNPDSIHVEFYTPQGTEYFTLPDLPVGRVAYFAGPDPFHSRKFYGNLRKDSAGNVKVQ